MKKFTIGLKIGLFLLLGIVLSAFSDPESLARYAGNLQKSLTDHYDVTQENNLIKRYELNVTNNGFCRYKRYFNNGKTEYFSFKLSKFKDMDYLGSNTSGRLCIRTKGEDVIVQTYKDRGGDVDSMAKQVIIPLKNIEAEDLNEMQHNLESISRLP